MRSKNWLLSWILALALALGAGHDGRVISSAWAHGGVDDEHSEPASVASTSSASGATETELELRLEDLGQSAPGASAPLAGARVRGFLKHGDGHLLSRITVAPGAAPGTYAIRFGDSARYSFPKPGPYLLELYVQPLRGEAFSTTVKFEMAQPDPAAASPWRHALPIAGGALALAALLLLLRRGRRPRSGKPAAESPKAESQSRGWNRWRP